MWVQFLEIEGFRNLASCKLEFSPGLNWLCGDNGQGKTNCLESLYFGLTSKSFRGGRLSDLVLTGEDKARVWVELLRGSASSKDSGRTRLGVEIEEGKCKRYLGNKQCNLFEFLRLGSVIAFGARSKNLVEGQPEDRRRFLDRMISYLDPDHMLALSKYRRIHGQLKKILLTGKDVGVFRGFKAIAAPIAHQIVRRRKAFLEEIRGAGLNIYTRVFSGSPNLFFEYRIRNAPREQDYEKRMVELCAQEMLHRKSMIGPHLDDISFRFQKSGAKHYASSGEVRAIVLSLKLAVRAAYREKYGQHPVLLLDDIDSELDLTKLKGLMAFLSEGGQTLISTSKYGTIEGLRQGRFFDVANGRIRFERDSE